MNWSITKTSPRGWRRKIQLFDYIEVFYNRLRIHSAAEYFATAEYEAHYRAQLKEAA
jgi:transposase InsO family protein